jgi:hypothetical protein
MVQNEGGQNLEQLNCSMRAQEITLSRKMLMQLDEVIQVLVALLIKPMSGEPEVATLPISRKFIRLRD